MERDGDHDSARRQRRLPLRARSMVAFGATALILSSSLAAINYLVTRSALIDQRQATAERQAFLNARAVRGGMEAGDDDPQSVLTVVQASSGGAALLLVGSDGYSTSVAVGRRHVPESLRDMVEDGRIGRQRVMLAGEPVVAVGVPLPAVDATYVEFVPMSEIEGTLDRVRVGLVAAAMVMTLVGVLAGRVASDRVLHPVRRMSRAARSIGEGALDRRLDSEGDADLEPLVESFNDMVDGLQSRIEREARFASDVSHELRSPLATIDAALSVARRRATEAQINTPRIHRFQQVEGLGDLQRCLIRQHHATRTEPDRVCVCGNMRNHELWRAAGESLGIVMLGIPHAVIAEFLRQLSCFYGLFYGF